ncbi:MAG: acyl-CoA dehydrogenase family protein [Campylobacteraceae bacterium]|jgi:alkylation response protein AidB-like acyl-CoA dehydrogenase|nr:acyl-CoA dehydrogenase family protein [Campylobacteraceae bacterium]
MSIEALRERFAPIFEKIAASAAERENKRELAYDEVKELLVAGFGALRVPKEFGGLGATIREQFELLIDLAAADSNLSQSFRPHLIFVEEQRLYALKGSDNAKNWLKRAVKGKFFGNAVTELGFGASKRYQTAVTRAKDGSLRLNGEKFYSTGSLYADYIAVAADLDGKRVSVAVAANAEGLTQKDDWDGFGQRLTASGSSTYNNVLVNEEDILGDGYGRAGRSWATAYLQLVLLASLAGIARRSKEDAIAWVRQRTRTFSHAPAALPRNDSLVQETVGQIASAAYGAKTAVIGVAETLDTVINAGGEDNDLLELTERTIALAQGVVINLSLDAASRIFETGGASVASSALALDRHWRNARTLAAHNPLSYKYRSLGANLLNGEELPYHWSAGVREV